MRRRHHQTGLLLVLAVISGLAAIETPSFASGPVNGQISDPDATVFGRPVIGERASDGRRARSPDLSELGVAEPVVAVELPPPGLHAAPSLAAPALAPPAAPVLATGQARAPPAS